MQGANGDKVLIRDGNEVSAYDGATNMLRTGERPPEADGPPEAEVASSEEIDGLLAEITPTIRLAAGAPVEAAGRWAYHSP